MNSTVLVLATTYPRWDGDKVPTFVADLSAELATQKLDVIVLAPHDPDAPRREVRSGVRVYRFPYFFPLRYQRVAYGGGILPSVTKSVLSALQIPFFVLSLFLHAVWLVHRENVDVINSHWAVPCGLVGAITSAVTGVRHVMTLHAGGVLGLHKAPFRHQIARLLYEQSDHITPVSTHIKGKFVELLPASMDVDESKFTVQPMGAHVSDFGAVDKQEARRRLGLAPDTVRGLFVGRLAEKKGVEQLLLAVELLSDTSDPFGLTIVGTGKLEAELREETRTKGLSDVVTFEGWVSDADLKAWYAAADFVVVPSVETDGGDTEGMPTVISEAFAAGTPVLATGVGGIPDVVEDEYSGLIVPQRRPDRLADGMARLIQDGSMRRRLAANAAEQAAALDWSKCAEMYSWLLHDTPDQPSSRRSREAV